MARVWPGERMRTNICGVGWASVGRGRCGKHARVHHIRPIFGLDMMGARQPGRLRPVWGTRLGRIFVTGPSTWAFEAGLGRPAVDALTSRAPSPVLSLQLPADIW